MLCIIYFIYYLKEPFFIHIFPSFHCFSKKKIKNKIFIHINILQFNIEYLTQKGIELSLAQVMQKNLGSEAYEKGEPITSLHMSTRFI